MTRLVLAAVVVLVAVAAADALRPDAKEQAAPTPPVQLAAQPKVHRASSGFVADGSLTRKRVLHYGKEYLSSAAIDAAFPSPETGEPFDIAHLAAAADGTLAVAVYRFPTKEPAEAAIELWREGELTAAFQVPPGSFGGGLGFADDGKIVATLFSDGHSVALFTRAGERVGSVSATSW